MSVELDARDRTILRLLQENGRITNAELADRVHLSASACLRRVKQLEDSGLIKSYTMVIDEKVAGFAGSAFVYVSLGQQGRPAMDRFERALLQHDEILECYLIAGQHDYTLRVVYRSQSDLERILGEIVAQLPGVARISSTVALRVVKRSNVLPA